MHSAAGGEAQFYKEAMFFKTKKLEILSLALVEVLPYPTQCLSAFLQLRCVSSDLSEA